MQYRPDIVITDRSGAAIAMVEVKALGGARVETATRYLRNLLAHGVVPHARYALLITPDTGYLWRTPEAVLQETAPSLTFPMTPIMQHYLPTGGGPARIGELVLESVVRQWLSDLADGITIDEGVTTSLREAGFLDTIRGSMINAQAPA